MKEVTPKVIEQAKLNIKTANTLRQSVKSNMKIEMSLTLTDHELGLADFKKSNKKLIFSGNNDQQSNSMRRFREATK